MKESVWGYAIIVLGILAVGIIWFFANNTRTDQHNYNLLKETTEAALIDSLDLAAYRLDGTIRIEEEKFVENLIRRFAENADLSNTYVIEIFDVNEEPPKVSLRVSSKKDTTATGEIVEFDMVNHLDAILETKYYAEEVIEEENVQNNNNNNNNRTCVTKSRIYNFRPTCTKTSNYIYRCRIYMTLETYGTITNFKFEFKNNNYRNYVFLEDASVTSNRTINFNIRVTSSLYSSYVNQIVSKAQPYYITYKHCY